MSNLMTHTQMAEQPVEKQALQAISHALVQIRDRGEVGYYLGLGTQTFDLLTEAYSSLTAEDVSNVRERFLCVDPIKPSGEDPEDAASDEGMPGEYEIIGGLEGMTAVERLELFAVLDAKFCRCCGGQNLVGPCLCRRVQP